MYLQYSVSPDGQMSGSMGGQDSQTLSLQDSKTLELQDYKIITYKCITKDYITISLSDYQTIRL